MKIFFFFKEKEIEYNSENMLENLLFKVTLFEILISSFLMPKFDKKIILILIYTIFVQYYFLIFLLIL